MSHFSVIVIGADPERQLAHFHEYECTACNDEFVQDVDITAKILERMTGDDAETLEDALSYYGLEERIVSDESEINTGAGQGYIKNRDDRPPHMWGYAIVKDGKLVKAVKRTNPNKKWDWWVIGGRWSGFLKLKAGATGAMGRKGAMGSCADDGPGRADQCLKAAVDFDGMRNEAGAQAGSEWDRAAAALADAGAPTTWATWDHLCDVEHKGNINAACEAYHAQPSVAAIKQAFDNDFLTSPDIYLVTRDVFVQRARDCAAVPYAFVKDGQWVGKGKMGWFGVSHGDAEQADWNRRFHDLLDSLPDDTLITVVDCHI